MWGILGITAAAGLARPQPADGPTPAASPQPTADPVERALDALRRSDMGAETEIDRLLRSPETAPRTVAGLAAFERLSPALWRGVSALTTTEHPEPLRLAAVGVLGRFGTRDAVVRLVALVDDPAPAVREASRTSLVELIGLGHDWDARGWRAWGDEMAAWSDRAWASAIITRHVAHVRALSDRQRTLSDEVVSLYRRLHVELDAPGRTALLAELIRDERNPLRDLGFELAGRDLSARTQLGPEVAIAAGARLNHPDPVTRAKAATLVGRLVPPDAMLTLTRALVSETNPAAAEPMLLGVARWPSEDALLPTVRWLERDDAPLGAVTTALWSLAQAGGLDDPPLRERVLAGLRARDLVRTGEPGMKLFVRFGNRDDLARVAAQLTSGDDPSRNAAANALAETPTGTGVLLDAATGDPRLFHPAARAIAVHMRTPEGLTKAAGLPSIDAEVKNNAILELSRLIPAELLGRAVHSANLTPALAERALGRLLDPDLERTPGVIEGLVVLARARLALGQPAQAGELLALINPDAVSPELVSEIRRIQLAARLAQDDLNGARGVGASLTEWLDAWRALEPGSPLRAPAATFILEQFASQMTNELRAELGAIAPVLTQPPAPEADAPGEEDTQDAADPFSGP